MLSSLSPRSRRTALLAAFWMVTLCSALASCSDTETRGGPSGDPAGAGGGIGGGAGGDRGDGDGTEYTPMGAPCEFGENVDKCAGLASVACTPTLFETRTNCVRDEQCGDRELCFESMDGDTTTGICLRLYGECLPRCGGDFDCTSGQECDIKSGACVERAENQGARFGESCESDEDCAGICVSLSETASECEEHCRVGAVSGCGFEDLSASSVACAYFAYTLSDFGENQGAGDVGICATLCNCNEDCPGEQKCSPLPTRGFAGVCTGGIDELDSLSTCPDVGAGGAPDSEAR